MWSVLHACLMGPLQLTAAHLLLKAGQQLVAE